MTIRFLLICEGPSDAALTQPIRRLLLKWGYTDPEGVSWTRGRQLADKIRLGLEHSRDCNLLLVHRDADAAYNSRIAGPSTRQSEIETAIEAVGYQGAWVGIIPVRTTETWLILEEQAIRAVVGRPQGNTPLQLPPPHRVEYESNPKTTLSDALVVASGASGRRLRKLRRDIPQLRRRLLEDLQVCGTLDQVPSWIRFKESLLGALEHIRKLEGR